MANIEDFSWGEILNIHEVGEYKIVEYNKYDYKSIPKKHQEILVFALMLMELILHIHLELLIRLSFLR